MKKIILCGVNSKYIHSNLAIRSIKKYYDRHSEKHHNVSIFEWTINNNLRELVRKICEKKPDMVVFSVYIWNRDYIFAVIGELKAILPGIKIAAGGPEVSYNAEKLLSDRPEIDAVIEGEGEKTFLEFIDKNESNPGVYKRVEGKIVYTGRRAKITELDEIPFPYDEKDFLDLNDKIIYYESSRGCPFSCSYCISSIDDGVRYLPLERVYEDLAVFLDKKVSLVKFVDRTFNLKKEWYRAIWDYLIGHYNGKTTFHFEICADLLDNDDFDILKDAPVGYFQFEIGIQTINKESMTAVNRIQDLGKISENIKKIGTNINKHLDLIAGLPYESYEAFGNSFDYVYNLKPNQIQLGFLKILSGTEMKKFADANKYVLSQIPPYEIYASPWLDYNEMFLIKDIEEAVDIYFNSERFKYTMDKLVQDKSPFSVFAELANYLRINDFFEKKHKPDIYFKIIDEFSKKKGYNISEELRHDFLLTGKCIIAPDWLEREDFRDKHRAIVEARFEKKEINGAMKYTDYDEFTESGKKRGILFIYKNGIKEIDI